VLGQSSSSTISPDPEHAIRVYEQHNTAVREIRRAGRRRITLAVVGGITRLTTGDQLASAAGLAPPS
jgi:hypothetical protein